MTSFLTRRTPWSAGTPPGTRPGTCRLRVVLGTIAGVCPDSQTSADLLVCVRDDSCSTARGRTAVCNPFAASARRRCVNECVLIVKRRHFRRWSEVAGSSPGERRVIMRPESPVAARCRLENSTRGYWRTSPNRNRRSESWANNSKTSPNDYVRAIYTRDDVGVRLMARCHRLGNSELRRG